MNDEAKLNQDSTGTDRGTEHPPERPSEVGPDLGSEKQRDTADGIAPEAPQNFLRAETAMEYPTIGRIVLYTLTDDDVQQVNRRRTTKQSIAGRISTDQWPQGAQAHIGNPVTSGQIFPAIVVVANGTYPSLKVLLDGTDELWKTSVPFSGGIGGWVWPARS